MSHSPAQVAAAMFSRDRASQKLGMTIEKIGDGFARLTMKVTAEMANGHDICHGGFIFALADSAFAFACNAGNVVTVAAGADIVFCRPAKVGDTLIAECRERCKYGRSGVYDAEVRNGKEEIVAVFQGRSRAIGGAVVTDEGAAAEGARGNEKK